MKAHLNPEIEPEYLRIADAARFSGIGRSTIFTLLKTGRLKSRVVRMPGLARGIRLISKQAIRDFIESCPDTPPGDGEEAQVPPAEHRSGIRG